MTIELFNKAPAGIFCFSDQGTLLQVNQTLSSILGYDPGDFTEKNVETIFTLSTRIFFQTHFFPLVKMQGHAEEIFLTLLTKSGEHLPVLLNAARIEWEGQPATCCACIVVPNRKKFEDELVRARKEAEQALAENSELVKIKCELQSHSENLETQMRKVENQNEELRQFNHVVTHNLKEPVRKMSVYASRMQEENPSALLDKLVSANRQMGAVVSGLQQYVWLNEKRNHFKKLDLASVIDKAVHQITLGTDSNLFALHIGHLDKLEADPEQVELLFFHILSNAIRFRRLDKVTINIHSDIVKQNRFRALETRYAYEDFLRIEVADDGIGFESAQREHIFELFRKLGSTEGQGVGLALCRKIAQNHGGYIEARGQTGKYAKIIIWLPLHQLAAEATS